MNWPARIPAALIVDDPRNFEKTLRTLDNVYGLLEHDENSRWMLILEIAIVLLFIVGLIVLFVTMK